MLAAPFLLNGGAGMKVYRRIGRALSRKSAGGSGMGAEESGADFFFGAWLRWQSLVCSGSTTSWVAPHRAAAAALCPCVAMTLVLIPLVPQVCWSLRAPPWWARPSRTQVGGCNLV